MTAGKDPRRKGRETFLSEVQRRRERHEEYVREGDASFWQSVGMMGYNRLVYFDSDYSGVLLGRWLDGELDSAHVFMVFFMLVGLVTGCVTAWRMIQEKI